MYHSQLFFIVYRQFFFSKFTWSMKVFSNKSDQHTNTVLSHQNKFSLGSRRQVLYQTEKLTALLLNPSFRKMRLLMTSQSFLF